MEENVENKFRKLLKPNASKIIATIVLFVFFSIIIAIPVHVDVTETNAWDGTTSQYVNVENIQLIVVLMHGGHWTKSNTINITHSSIFMDNWVTSILYEKEYTADYLSLVILTLTIMVGTYLLSCVLDEYTRMKSRKTY